MNYTLWVCHDGATAVAQTDTEPISSSIAGLSDPISDLPGQKDLWLQSREEYGGAWCGGQIEASLRAVT